MEQEYPKYCFECETGEYTIKLEDYVLPTNNSGNNGGVVKDAIILVCKVCHSECIPPITSKRIDEIRFKNK